MGRSLILEAAVVGATLSFAFFISHALFPRLNHLALLFILGDALHLAFEYTGVNLWFCRQL